METLSDRSSVTHSAPSIPVIDFQPFLTGDFLGQKAVVSQLSQVLKEVGSFYLGNTISKADIDQIFSLMRYFFTLPETEKDSVQLIKNKPQTQYQGLFFAYHRTGIDAGEGISEKLNLMQRHLSETDRETEDSFDLENHPQDQWVLRHLEFCTAIRHHYLKLENSMFRLLEALAMVVDAPQDYFVKHHSTESNNFLLLHYPKLPQASETSSILKRKHTDFGTCSLLCQDPTGGLEMLSPSEEWLDVVPLPDAPIVIFADLISRWTNDKIPATIHQVRLPINLHPDQGRDSFGFFAAPREDAEIVCLDTCLAPDETPKYPPILAGDYYLQKADEGEETKKRLQS